MKCSACGILVTPDRYLWHLRNYHQDDKNLNLTCLHCPETFKTVPTYQKHHYAKHHVSKVTVNVTCSSSTSVVQPRPQEIPSQSVPEPVNTSEVPSAPDCAPAPESVGDIPVIQSEPAAPAIPHQDEIPARCSASPIVLAEETSGDLETDTESESDSDSASLQDSGEDNNVEDNFITSGAGPSKSSSGDIPSVNKQAATLVLSLREKNGMSKRAMSEVMQDSEVLLQDSLHDFASKINTALQSKNISLNEIIDVGKTVQSSSNVFQNLKTVSQQDKYFKSTFGVVNPKQIPLGKEFRRVRKRNSSIRKTVMVSEEVMYIPVEEVVEKLVTHPDYKYFVENGSVSPNSDILDSYMKGEMSKKNDILKSHPDALRFILYYDDLEVCSPLKSRAGNQKLGAFYILIDNIPLKFRSNLAKICLVALVKAGLIKGNKYGIDAAVDVIVEGLKKFEEGVTFSNGKKVYGTVIASIGDNLGSHGIGGFKEGFTAKHGCRYCMASYPKDVQRMTREDSSLLRTREMFNEQVAKVQTTRGKNQKLSTEFGINRDSPLNTLKSFHVVDCLPPDLLHDYLEGILSLAVKRLLRYYVYEKDEKPFTLEWVNQAVQGFDYEYSEVGAKPSELKEQYIKSDDTALHQSGSQLWMLAVILPLIVGPIVDVNEEHFQNFLDMLDICRIVFSPSIPKWMLSYLKDQIDVYLTGYIKLYGPLIPKQHHMIHYPTQILRMGPAALYNCIRCEAKHRFFKKLVETLGNYKNIPKSLAIQHQLNQAYVWNKSLRTPPAIGPCNDLDVRRVSYGNLLETLSGPIKETKWLKTAGIKFVAGRCYVIMRCENFLPIFGRVEAIILQPSLLFVCQEMHTSRRDGNLAAYGIQFTDKFCIFKLEKMLLPYVFHAHRCGNESFIVMKYCPGDFL